MKELLQTRVKYTYLNCNQKSCDLDHVPHLPLPDHIWFYLQWRYLVIDQSELVEIDEWKNPQILQQNLLHHLEKVKEKQKEHDKGTCPFQMDFYS